MSGEEISLRIKDDSIWVYLEIMLKNSDDIKIDDVEPEEWTKITCVKLVSTGRNYITEKQCDNVNIFLKKLPKHIKTLVLLEFNQYLFDIEIPEHFENICFDVGFCNKFQEDVYEKLYDKMPFNLKKIVIRAGSLGDVHIYKILNNAPPMLEEIYLFAYTISIDLALCSKPASFKNLMFNNEKIEF